MSATPQTFDDVAARASNAGAPRQAAGDHRCPSQWFAAGACEAPAVAHASRAETATTDV